jgi:Cu2+-containing amine oxidase
MKDVKEFEGEIIYIKGKDFEAEDRAIVYKDKIYEIIISLNRNNEPSLHLKEINKGNIKMEEIKLIKECTALENLIKEALKKEGVESNKESQVVDNRGIEHQLIGYLNIDLPIIMEHCHYE